MVEEIWRTSPGMCKEDTINRDRNLSNFPKNFKDIIESKKIGIYKKDSSNLPPEKKVELYKKIFNGTTSMYTGISSSDNESYLHLTTQIDNKNGINLSNNLSNFGKKNKKDINFDKFSCYAPIPWEEYTGNCNGENIKKESINLDIKKNIAIFDNHYDVQCKKECLNDEDCQGYGTKKNKCTKYYGKIIGGDGNSKNYCKVKPAIYKYKNYEEIDNLYKNKIETNKKMINRLNKKLKDDKQNIIDKKNDFLNKSLKNIDKDIENQKIDLNQKINLKKNYINVLSNFHKQESGKNVVDKKSTGVIGSIFQWNKNNLTKNDKLIKNIGQNLDTVDRQGSIVLNSILRRDKMEIFLKLVLLYLIIWILLLFFKKINIINKDGINYIMFFVTVLIGGLVFIRLSQNNNRSKYSYTKKIFHSEIKEKKD